MRSFSTRPLLCLSLLLLLSSPVLSQKSMCAVLKGWRGTLEVTIIRGWDLKGDVTGRTESYVKMRHRSFLGRTPMIRSNNPQWDAYYHLGEVDTRLGLQLEVWDEDVLYDERLGSCVMYPREGTHRFTCRARRGGIEIEYTLTCECPLTGSRCEP